MSDFNGEPGSFPPWSRIPSLAEMTAEAGIDFDQFVDCLKKGWDNREMADRFRVSEASIDSLKEHFNSYGISSVIGGD